MSHLMKNQRGVTLVELIIAMAVTTLVLGAVYMAVNATQRHSAGIERKVVAQQDVKAALNLMALEISMASYNPGFSSDLWRTANDCANLSANQDYRGIQEATANALTVEMDLDADGDTTGTNEKIRYSYNTTGEDRYIARAVGCGGEFISFLGARLASGDPRNVLVINNECNPVIPVFRYFDGEGAEIGTANLPADIPKIRRIVITLAVETEHIDPNTGQRRRLIYSTSVIPRNHVIANY